ncbi:MAG: tetratricopeptide repeat protein [Bauldia sp.]|nr:tetratricopeptide repeat protein [Bauldia sp.]
MLRSSRGFQPTLPGRLRRATILVPVILALGLGGCAGQRAAAPDPIQTGAISIAGMGESELGAAAAYWGERYAANPDDRTAALNYGTILTRLSRTEQAVAVLQRAALNFPDDRDVMAAYGKALASAGRFSEALTIIRRAQLPDRPDWRLLSAEAAILDQIGQHGQARALYDQALDLAPNEPSLWSNLGMSYALAGDLVTAEQKLRHAITLPGADSRVRQNLALVVGLQGRFDEAERIARQELSPAQAEANVAYLRQMLGSQDSWSALASEG